jgi:dienelactone hydrolase
MSSFEISPPNVSLVFASSSIAQSEFTERPVLADVNGDGKLDLIGEAGGTADVITVRLGNGDGTFQTEVQYPTAVSPNYPLVGDFNDDGKIDIAVLCESGVVSILLGNGDGTFQSHIDSPIDPGLHNFGMAAGDLNGDGKLDLVVGYQDPKSSSISVLLGNGDGTFRAPVDYSAGSEPGAVAIADLNGDGKLDIVAANFGNFGGNTISVLLGNGDGTFLPQVQYTTSGGPLWVVVADFNHDGKLDLAVDCSCGTASRCGYPGSVSILLGNGDGTFRAHVDYPVDAFPYSLAAGDLTGRGVLDLAVTDLDYNELSILLGHGDGTFGAATTFPTSNRPVGVVLADLNNDGRLDAVVGTDAGFSIFLQAGTVALSPPSLEFGGKVLGTTSTAKTVTLTNVGATTVTISSIALAGTDAADFTKTKTCRSSLAPNAHCTISVNFSPSQLGPRAAAITFTDSAPGSPQSVPLSGFGVTSGPNATLSATKLTFATQLVGTSSAAQAVTLTDYGTTALSITRIVASGDFRASNNCGSSLAALASCTISVTFKPTAAGVRTGTLSITDNAPGSPQTVSLQGTGTDLLLNPASLSYGTHPVGTSTTLSTKMSWAGSTTLNITGITITGADPGDFSQTNTCGTSLGTGSSCTIYVTFKPAALGGRSADVSISDSAVGSPQQVVLSGAGCHWVKIGRRRVCELAAASLGRSAVQSALAMNRTPAVPNTTGPSKVGTRVMDLVDSTRNDPFVANGSKRELLLRFWYPASLGQGCKRAEYASPRVWSYVSQLVGIPLPEVKTNSCLDAPMVEGAHPVVVFTHGYTGTFTDYTFLFEDLASRGYVVASVDHTYEATAVEFPDGRFVPSKVGSHFGDTWRIDDQALSFALSVRLKDLEFVANELDRLNVAPGSPFAGKLDTSRIGLMGHSLGGQATISGIEQDPRFRAGVVLDEVVDGAAAGTDRPILMLTAGREQKGKDECKLWNNLRGPRLAVNLKGAEHLTPSDAVWLAKGAIRTGDMGPDKTVAAMRHYIAAFLDANLRGTPVDDLLTGPSSDYPDAALTTQQQSLCGEAIDH